MREISRTSPEWRSNYGERYEFYHADIAERGPDRCADGRSISSSRCINFAAESHVDRSIDSPQNFIHTNVVGTATLLDAARRHGVRRFVQISTDEVYGSLGAEGTVHGDLAVPAELALFGEQSGRRSARAGAPSHLRTGSGRSRAARTITGRINFRRSSSR